MVLGRSPLLGFVPQPNLHFYLFHSPANFKLNDHYQATIFEKIGKLFRGRSLFGPTGQSAIIGNRVSGKATNQESRASWPRCLSLFDYSGRLPPPGDVVQLRLGAAKLDKAAGAFALDQRA